MARPFKFYTNFSPATICATGYFHEDHPSVISSREVDNYINSYDLSDYCGNKNKGEINEQPNKTVAGVKRTHQYTRGEWRGINTRTRNFNGC